MSGAVTRNAAHGEPGHRWPCSRLALNPAGSFCLRLTLHRRGPPVVELQLIRRGRQHRLGMTALDQGMASNRDRVVKKAVQVRAIAKVLALDFG